MITAIILGTRPEIIKMSPMIREFERRGMEFFILHTGHGNKAKVIFQTGLAGSTGCVLSFNHVDPVIPSRMRKPQMNINERRCINVTDFVAQSNGSIHRKGREERKAQLHKSLYLEEIIRRGTRMSRIKRIYTGPCASVSSAQSVFHRIPPIIDDDKKPQGNKEMVVFQTGFTGFTGCVLSFNQVHPVIMEANF